MDIPLLNGLDLFSGYGGISLGLRDYVRPVAYCEIEPYAQGILLSRMADGSLANAPIWDDVETLDGRPFRGEVDIITAGFPCQDISTAGTGEGLEGRRSGLFREVVRLAKQIQPTFLFLENVPAIRTRGLDEVVRELTSLGYDLRWTMLSAADVGAPHKRLRWFCLGYSDHEGSSALAYVPSRPKPVTARSGWWAHEPDVARVVDGFATRVDRVKAIGNGVVPQQVVAAFEELMHGR